MSIAGGAIIPQIYAALAKLVPPQTAFLLCVLPAYLYVAFYATKGYRWGLRSKV